MDELVKTLGTNVPESIFWKYKQICASHSQTVTQRLRDLVMDDIENESKISDETDNDENDSSSTGNVPATPKQYQYINVLRDQLELPPLDKSLTITEANEMIRALKIKVFPRYMGNTEGGE